MSPHTIEVDTKVSNGIELEKKNKDRGTVEDEKEYSGR